MKNTTATTMTTKTTPTTTMTATTPIIGANITGTSTTTSTDACVACAPNASDTSVYLLTAIPAYLGCISAGGSCQDASPEWLQSMSTVSGLTCASIIAFPISCASSLGWAESTLPDPIVRSLAASFTIDSICCATCASPLGWDESNATTTPMMPVVAQMKVAGSLTMTLNGAPSTDVNTMVVEAAARNAIAEHFGVVAESISVTATESRRLNVNRRRLAGTWNIIYEFRVISAMVAFVQAMVDTATNAPANFLTTMATTFKAHLEAAGVPESVTNGLEATSATVAMTDTATTPSPILSSTTPIFRVDEYMTAGAHTTARMAIIIAIAMLGSCF